MFREDNRPRIELVVGAVGVVAVAALSVALPILLTLAKGS